MKIWFTARELADLSLPGLPVTESAMIRRAKRQEWIRRKRDGSGGGWEYSLYSIPHNSRAAYLENLTAICDKKALEIAVGEGCESKSKRRFDARLIILKHFELYKAASQLNSGQAIHTYCLMYAGHMHSELPSWVYEIFAQLSPATIWRWQKTRKQNRFEALGKSQNNRSGTGVFHKAESGKLYDFIAALLVKQIHLNAAHIRDLCLAQFGPTVVHQGKERDMPCIRQFNRFILDWKKLNADIFDNITNPDAFKNKNQMALGRADDGVERLNQIWEIDASPADVLCEDGRHSIYAIIDVWSRRAMFLVSKTARTEASLLLIRKAIRAWGVPETIKTDNGSDFVSHRFTQALLHLDITQRTCKPFTPESKPFVERVIKTLQHGLMPLLPGYIGHSVKDRKQIEARKSFAARLGEPTDKAFAISLTSEGLQQAIDAWARDKYGKEPHSGLSGVSPFVKASGWMQPIQQIPNERALDLLLAPLAGADGYRTVGKKGIKVNHGHFYGPGLELYVGKRVFARFDVEDLGKIYVFDEDQVFICEATNIDRLGANRAEAAMLAKQNQKQHFAEQRKEMRRITREITPESIAEKYLSHAARNSAQVTEFPRQSEIYSTPQLDQAGIALSKTPITERNDAEKTAHSAFVTDFYQKQKDKEEAESQLSDHDRYWQRAKGLITRIEAGEEISATDFQWLEMAKTRPWYQSNEMFERMKVD